MNTNQDRLITMPEFDISQYNITVSMEDLEETDENDREEDAAATTETTVELPSNIKTSNIPGLGEDTWSRWLFTQIYDHLQNSPDKVAVIEEITSTRYVTYGEVVDGVMRTANYLSHHGVKMGDRVVICMENCIEYVYYELALFLIGALPILLNPGHVASDRCEKVRCSVVVVDSDHYGHVLRSFKNWIDLKQVFILSDNITSIHLPRNVWIVDGFGYLDFPCDYPYVKGRADSEVVAFSTSGTSYAKNRVVSHCAKSAHLICSQYYQQLFGLLQEKDPDYDTANGTHLLSGGLYTIESWSYMVFSLITGQTCIITESNADVWKVSSLDRLAGLIEQYKIPLITSHTQFLKCLVKYEVHNLYNISSLLMIAHSGSTLPPSIAKKVQETLRVSIVQSYSSTEFGVIAFDEVRNSSGVILSCGEPLPGTDVKVADMKTETELGPSDWGRIMIKGPTMFHCYIHEKPPTDCFLKNGWFRTDDYGMMDEQARLFVAGPMEGMFDAEEGQIAPSLMENVLIDHPAVDDIAVAEVEGVMIAGVVLKEGADIPIPQDLQKVLLEHDIKTSLDKVVLVDFIPRSETGKVMRLEIPYLLTSDDTIDENESSI